MSHSTAHSIGQYVTAFFDDRDDAEEAVANLVETGIAKSDIRMVGGNESSAITEPVEPPVHEKGFFESLGDLFMADEDRHTYAEGLRRGGYLVSVPTTAANREQILDILDHDGTIDIDGRVETWGLEGWSGRATGDDAGIVRLPPASSGIVTPATRSAGYSESASLSERGSPDASRDDTIEVMEERLRVGKRDVGQGRVRVKSYIVEDAVSEDVRLRSERVEIER